MLCNSHREGEASWIVFKRVLYAHHFQFEHPLPQELSIDEDDNVVRIKTILSKYHVRYCFMMLKAKHPWSLFPQV